MNKFIKLSFVLVSSLFLMFVTPTLAFADEAGIIFLGDSRTEGQNENTTAGTNEFYAFKSGQGLTWLKKDGEEKVKSIVSAHPTIKSWTITTNLGVNDVIDNADGYITEYNSLLSGDWKDYSVYFVSVNPVDESKCKDITNANVTAFNDKVKAGVTGFKGYIDTYSAIKDGLETDSEGLHYTKAEYQKIYDTIKSSLGSSATKATATGEATAGDVKSAMSSSVGTEDSIPGMNKKQSWGGEDITLADGSDLTTTEKGNLTQWGDDIKSESSNFWINLSRRCVAFTGIVAILFSLFLYLSYWLDRVNNFVEVNFLGILSFGQLAVSPDDETSTFSPKTKGIKLVVHRDMIKIVLIGLLLGILMLSGHIFTFIASMLSLAEKVKTLF